MVSVQEDIGDIYLDQGNMFHPNCSELDIFSNFYHKFDLKGK